jgi:DNA-binding MarR family transcriptional regulator
MRSPVLEIDETIHQRVRLGIMALVHSRGRASFNDIKSELELTDGNLSVHLSVLERAGLIGVEKTFSGKRPCTIATLTEAGRAALSMYLAALERVVRSVGQAPTNVATAPAIVA